MNIKKLNYLVLSWAVNLAEQDVEDETIDFAVGGQAVIEGVMMRSPNAITIAVRKPDGEITVKKERYQTLIQRIRRLNIPVVRGVINLFEMMIIGTRAINYSANESMEEEDRPKNSTKHPKLGQAIEMMLFIISFVVAMAFSLALFKAAPLWIATFIQKYVPAMATYDILFNLVDGVLKALIFLGYIFLLSLIPSFRRVFEYHGAEHKSIFAYESKQGLNVKNAEKQSRFHPRCGTSFIIIVFIISIAVYTFIPRQDSYLQNLALRILVLPLIAGISYEFLKLSATYSSHKIVRMLIAPGLAFQKLTTKEPDSDQLQVGLKSLKEALVLENSK